MTINIIGAGVSGLSAGCYLQMNGFKTEIFERHSTFGGLCTSWKRGGYTFESGLQWLLGSNKHNPFFRLWSELIDMESIRFIHHEIRMDLEMKNTTDRFGDRVFHLYSNISRLETYLLSIAPEDKDVLQKLVRTIRKIQKFEIPPMIKIVPDLIPWHQKIGMIRHLRLLFFMNSLKKETNFSFAGKLKNPFLKEAFGLLFDGDDLPLLIITVPLAFNDLESTGYPAGGSLDFVGRLEKKYISLGGKIRYNMEVAKITTDQNRATGLQLKSGEQIASDITISAADWHFTIFKALEGKYVNKTILELEHNERLKIYDSVFMVSLGVKGSFADIAHFFRFQIPDGLKSPDGTVYERMECHVNNYDAGVSPSCKTVISVSFYTHQADFWINLRESDRSDYNEQKNRFADQVIAVLDKKLSLKEFIEVVDIATPATYHRYTNNWKGSVQGWQPGKNIIARSPVKSELPGLKGFYMVGHWSIPGGGLPVAIKSARDISQVICHRAKIPFKPE